MTFRSNGPYVEFETMTVRNINDPSEFRTPLLRMTTCIQHGYIITYLMTACVYNMSTSFFRMIHSTYRTSLVRHSFE